MIADTIEYCICLATSIFGVAFFVVGYLGRKPTQTNYTSYNLFNVIIIIVCYVSFACINRFSFINQFISVLQFSLLYLGCFNAVASVYNVLRGFNRSSTLSLAFSFPSSEGVFMSVVVDMNEVYCFNAGHAKLNTQAISK